MSSSYLPEKVFAVCTHNTNGDYGKLLKDTEVRGKYTVLFKSKDKPLLTVADKKLDGQFSCKTNWSSGVGTAAFGAGIMVGLGIAATVATIPVAGWIVGGAIALGCIAWGLFSFFSKPSCSDMIGYQESFWTNEHSRVVFDGFYAVTKQSMIVCKEGGFLLPFINETAASEAASEIAVQNRIEVGITIGANFVAGVLSGWAAGSVHGTAALASTKEIATMTGLGIVLSPLMQLGTAAETAGIRAIYDNDDNSIYDTITAEDDISWIPDGALPKPIKEPLIEHTGEDDNPDESFNVERDDVGDAWNPKGFYDKFKGIRKGLYEQKRALIRQGASERRIATINSQIADIDRALKRAEVTKSFAGKKNPYGRKVLREIQRGAYGPEAQKIFSNRSEDGKKNKRVKGAKREKLYQGVRDERTQALNGHQNDLQEYKDNQRKGENRVRANTALRGPNGGMLLAPFINTLVSEYTLKIAADAALEDMANSITIAAREH